MPVGTKVDKMNLSFQASSKFSSDWMFLKLLRDPTEKWRVDMYGQSLGEQEWLPLFSKVVGLSDETSDREGVSSERADTAPPASLVEPREMPDAAMTVPPVEPRPIPREAMRMARVEGAWL